MKLTKAKLQQIIKEEIGSLREGSDDGGTVTGPPPGRSPDPFAGDTVAGPGGFEGDQAGAQDVKKKAAALDKVEKLLTNLIKQIRSL